MARPRAVSKGGAGYTPKSGWAAGQHFKSRYAYDNATAIQGGDESYGDRARKRQEASEILEGRRPWINSPALRRDPKGEVELRRAWTEGKLMGIARRAGRKNAAAQHARNMDFALMDLNVLRRGGFNIEEDFWYH